MWDFLKKIFSEREGDVTVVVLDDQDPDGSASFKLQASDIIKIALLVGLVSVIITTVIFFATPLGSFYQHRQDENLRQEVISISERVMTLQDSLLARDSQLSDMKEVLRSASDTSFAIEGTGEFINTDFSLPSRRELSTVNAFDMLSQNEIIFSGNLETNMDFPANYPIRGTLTQRYSADQGHYGLDIAASPGTEFRSLANGTVLSAGWTINYGYVIYIQHASGIISVYKHGSRLLKQQGDFVLKGDILGSIGDRGVVSSGSHLHLEIWKNGVPQDPDMYLIN
ncbi:MAG: M23 family metallopeptidase [Balneolaceae bacterium]